MTSQVSGATQDWETLQMWFSTKDGFLSLDKGRIVSTDKPKWVSRFIEAVKSFFGSSSLEGVARHIALMQGKTTLTAEQQKIIDKINEKISDFNDRSVFRHPKRIPTALFDSIVAPEKLAARKKELLETIKSQLRPQDLELPDEELLDKIVRFTACWPIEWTDVHTVEHSFPESSERKNVKLLSFQLRGGRVGSIDSLFAAARAIFGSQNKRDRQELRSRSGIIDIFVEKNLQNIDIKARPITHS